MRIHLKSDDLFALAGLWNAWKSPEGNEIKSFTIITRSTEGDRVMQPLHERMPLVLDLEAENEWIDFDADPAKVIDKIVKSPHSEMECYEVASLVNSPKNDIEKCIEPVFANL